MIDNKQQNTKYKYMFDNNSQSTKTERGRSVDKKDSYPYGQMYLNVLITDVTVE